MTPGARVQAATELLDAILIAWQSEKRIPADKLIDHYFKSRRFIGSKDRAFIGELVYWCLRHLASLKWWLAHAGAQETACLLVLAALLLRRNYDISALVALPRDGKYSIPPLGTEEKAALAKLSGQPPAHPDMPEAVRLNYPAWMEPTLKENFGGEYETALEALSKQAPTDLRVNTLKTTRDALLSNLHKEGFDVSPTPLSPVGLRLAKRAPIFTSRWFKEGHFEVQDEGSQLVSLLVDAQPGQKVIDFCAGAGGKTLAMAAAMENKGRILAWDTSEKRLGQISQRLRRAGVHNVQTHVLVSEHDAFIKRHKHSADRVLVDAPCSGSGTWRRNPDLKWRVTPADLEEMKRLQQTILQSASRLVKPGGRLVYATCSLLKEENDRQVENLLKNINDFTVVCAKKIWDKNAREAAAPSYLWVTPHQDGVDGFFAAVLERKAN